jgi:DNA replication protein DnaC
MKPLFLPFAPTTAPRRAVEAALAALPPEACPRHPGEILELNREACLRGFESDNTLEFTAVRDPGEWDRYRWASALNGVKPPPSGERPSVLDVPPAVLLAQWAATLSPDRAPLAALAAVRLAWRYHATSEEQWTYQEPIDDAPADAPDWHYVLRVSLKPCLACAVAAVGVPPILQEASFSNFDDRDGSLTKHLAACQAFAENPKGTLLLMGGVGGGKSHQGAAIVRANVHRRPKPLFLSHLRLLELYRRRYQAFDPDNPPADIIDQCRAAGILVLDDLGRRQGGKDEENILHAVLNHRHECLLPTVLTGNLDRADLHVVLGDALFDRLSQNNCGYLTFGVSSYRPQMRDAYLAASAPSRRKANSKSASHANPA